MALREVRNINGGDIPMLTGTVKGAYVKGCPLYRNVSDGKLTTVATNGTKIIGFLADITSADGDTASYIPCYPSIQFRMDFDGTYAITLLGTYVEITVASGVPTANLSENSNDILRLEEVVDNDSTNSVYTAWFSAADTANQWEIEVA